MSVPEDLSSTSPFFPHDPTLKPLSVSGVVVRTTYLVVHNLPSRRVVGSRVNILSPNPTSTFQTPGHSRTLRGTPSLNEDERSDETGVPGVSPPSQTDGITQNLGPLQGLPYPDRKTRQLTTGEDRRRVVTTQGPEGRPVFGRDSWSRNYPSTQNVHRVRKRRF